MLTKQLLQQPRNITRACTSAVTVACKTALPWHWQDSRKRLFWGTKTSMKQDSSFSYPVVINQLAPQGRVRRLSRHVPSCSLLSAPSAVVVLLPSCFRPVFAPRILAEVKRSSRLFHSHQFCVAGWPPAGGSGAAASPRPRARSAFPASCWLDKSLFPGSVSQSH